MIRAERPLGRLAAAALLILLLNACSHMPTRLWPWGNRQAPPPQPVHELIITTEGADASAAFPQYWKRNTLVIDLRSATGTGSITVRPRTSAQWPVRIALRVTPGGTGMLDVHAAQRLVLPITPEGAKPVDLELPAGAYSATTAEIRINWGSMVTSD